MAVLLLSLIGVALVAAGFVAAYRRWHPRPGVPPADWFPDPSVWACRERLWDSQAWTPSIRLGGTLPTRGRLFRGRFWGHWVWVLLGTIGVLVLGSLAYQATGVVHVIALTTFLAMGGLCVAFYWLVSRQLALHDVIGPAQAIPVGVASAGVVLLFAANINSLVISVAGVQVGTITVGFVEESSKLFVPLLLYVLGRYRDPRAGIAIGLAAGFGFAIVEATQYAYATAAASGPDLCGNETVAPTADFVIDSQVLRIFTVEPLHWLWTAAAVAVAWRLWHLYGARGTPGAVAAILAVMVVHSANDTSATYGCHSTLVSLLTALFRWAILIGTYFVFKAMARKSTPPQLIGVVSRGWTPHGLRTK